MSNRKSKKRSLASKSETYEYLNSKLSIYRDYRTKKQNYIARILLDNGTYKLVSTKTDKILQASRKALEIYEDLQLRQRHHIPLSDPTLQDVLEHWTKHDGSKLTPKRREVVISWFEKVFEAYLVTVLGNPQGLKALVRTITPQELDQFASWRISDEAVEQIWEYEKKKYAHRPRRKQYARKTPSRKTLGLEIGNYNVVIRAAKRHNLIDESVLMPTLSKSSADISGITKEVRPSINTFDDAQVKAISHLFKTSYLKHNSIWNKGICALDDEGNGLRNDDGSTRSKGTMYLSKVNLYCSWFILLNTGIRLSELHSLKWKDVQKHYVEDDAKGRPKNIYLLRVNETKPLRVKAMVPSQRIVVGPARIENWLNLLKEENPKYSQPDDYVINFKGQKRSSQQVLFEKVQLVPKSWKGKPVNCSEHASGTPLDLRHLRSYYVSKMLLEKRVPPQMLVRQTGHSLDTILQFYLTTKPMKAQMLTFGGWAIEKEMVSEVLNLAL